MKFSLFWFSVIFLSAFLGGCKKDDSSSSNVEDKYFVPLGKAEIVAKNLLATPIVTPQGAVSGRDEVDVYPPLEVKLDGKTTYYIFNYKNQSGFSVIAADYREDPILAFSTESRLRLDSVPEGVEQWLEVRAQRIKELGDSIGLIPSAFVLQQWFELGGEDVLFGPLGDCSTSCPNYPCCLEENIDCDDIPCNIDDPDPCESTYVEKGPLITTKWGQGCGYNAECPIVLFCDEDLPCDNGYTGCVATSMAQILKFHSAQLPSPFNRNWASMPNALPPLDVPTEVSGLMADLGDIVNMDYVCSGSGATMGAACSGFENELGYSSSADLVTYQGTSNYQTVVNNIIQNQPVLFGGHRKKKFLGISYRGSGHAWVCDGYKRYSSCEFSLLWFHMNWGWDGAFNGWFAYNNFTVADRNYDYKSEVIVGIKPQ
jgi:hypothetical protein